MGFAREGNTVVGASTVASSGQGSGEKDRRQALLLSSFVQRQRLPDLGEPRRSAVGLGDDAAVAAVACHCYRWAWARRGCVLLKGSMTLNKFLPFCAIEDQ